MNVLKTHSTMQREMSACMSHIATNGASAHEVCSGDGSISMAITAVVMSIIAIANGAMGASIVDGSR